MKTLWLKITAESPLALSERKPGGSQFQEGLKFIPGTVVRGAVASVLGYERKPGFEALWQAIISEEAHFGDASPGIGARPRLLPATATSCKDHPGFLKSSDEGNGSDESLDNPHGVFDTLLDQLCWETLKPKQLLYEPKCPELTCGKRVRAFSGWYTIRDGRYYAASLLSQLLTRVALNRRRAVAEDQLLYSVNALSEWMEDPLKPRDWPQRDRLVASEFRGPVYLPGDAAAQLVKLLADIDHIGGGGSRGLGRVKITLDDLPAEEAGVTDRVAAFNTCLAQRKTAWESLARQSIPEGVYFTVDLQSDAVLRREWQQTDALDEDLLRTETGVQAGASLVRSYASNGYRGGWQGAWGLPKDVDAVARAGSVYVFHTADLAPWVDALAMLEESGIGERRGEGFGRVRICDEFHTVTWEEAR